MAYITNKKNIFFVTSPRTPFKMKEEITLLINNFEGEIWNQKTQTQFAERLSQSKFFEGKIQNNLDFAARDRVNRAPKALGFVNLQPRISITKAGKQFISNKRSEEIFLRQLIKFQLPSPYHIDINHIFNVKPYLELLRLVVDLEGVSKDEIALFVMQLTNINKYNIVVDKILSFRKKVKNMDRRLTSYRRLVNQIYKEEIATMYEQEISLGKVGIRESGGNSLDKFIETKRSNFRDYADAAIRYLRATELLTFDYKTSRLLVSRYKTKEIDFILKNVERSAQKFYSIEEFKEYLFDDSKPYLLSDNKEGLISDLFEAGVTKKAIDELADLSLVQVKDKRDEILQKIQEENVVKQVQELQSYLSYEDIVKTYDDIIQKNIVDPSLVFEWNTWRAFTMLDDGNIEGNFKFDLQGMPLFNAPGNKPDIECEYKGFNIIVEVTLSSGYKQYEMEGEPVARHLGLYQKETGIETFCIFITQKLSQATLAHFYLLHKTNVAFYGGRTKIIPLEINEFLKIIKKSSQSKTKPNSHNLYSFVSNATKSAEMATDEISWYQQIVSLVDGWLIEMP